MKIRPHASQALPPQGAAPASQKTGTPADTGVLSDADKPTAEVADRFQQALKDNTRVAKALPSVAFAATEKTEAPRPKDWANVTVAARQDNMKALQDLAHRLRDQGTPGVEIWGALRREAVSRYAQTDLSPQRQADFVMQDLTLATVGKDALKYLAQYEGLPRLGKTDPLVDTFQADWKALGVPPADDNWEAVGWAGQDLDTHTAKDFRPEINDKTKNQIFHTMFYEFMGYVTQDDLMIRAGSIVHEVRDGLADGGLSTEDHNASYVGTAVGKAFRQMRDGQHTEAALKQWGALTLAAYGKDGGPEVRNGSASGAAQQMHQQISQKLKDKGLMWHTENFLIQSVDQLNNGFQRLRELF